MLVKMEGFGCGINLRIFVFILCVFIEGRWCLVVGGTVKLINCLII